MKTINLDVNKQAKLIALLITIMSVISVTFFSQLTGNIFLIFWLVGATLILILLTPLGSIKLPTNKLQPKVSLFKKTILIVLIELALLCAYASFCNMMSSITPSNIQLNPHLFSHTLSSLMIHYGLFSWTILTLLTLGLAYRNSVQSQDGYYSQLCYPLIKNCAPGQPFAAFVNTSLQMSNRVALSGLIITLAVLLTHWLLSGMAPVIHNLNTATILFSLIAVISIQNKYIQQLLTRSVLSLHPTIICLILAAGIAIILTLLSIPSSLTQHTLPIANVIQTYTKQHPNSLWLLISLCWWFCCAPLLAPICARVCYGYSIRHTLLTIMALPLCCALMLYLHNKSIINLNGLFHFINNSPFGHALCFLAIIGLLALVFSNKNSASTVLASMPLPQNRKHRSPLLTLRGLFILSLLSLTLYLCLGPWFITWFWLFYTAIPLISVICINVNLLKILACELSHKIKHRIK